MNRRPHIFRALFRPAVLVAILWQGIGISSAAGVPKVVASIVPVHSLVAAVMEGVGRPFLLVPGNVSPHQFALRPSETRRIAEADVVFWIGPGYEIFLAKPLANGKALSVPLVQAPGLTLLPVRAGGIWEHGQGGNASADTGHTHSHHQHGAGTDMHFWLDPANARAMVTATAETMAKYDPAHAMRYRKNASAAVGRLSTLEADFRATLAPVRQRPFVVFHDAFQYFEKRFGLAGSGSVLSHSGARPGARRVLALRRKFAETGIVCVFREPQFNPKLTAAIIRGTRVRMGALDPLGSGLPIGVGAYEALLRGLARDIVSCLEKR